MTKKWARKHDKCIKCGTTEKKHKSKGLCGGCYSYEHRHKIHKDWNCEICGTNTNKNTKYLCMACNSKRLLSIIHDDWECKECKTNTKKSSKELCINCKSRKERNRKHNNWKCSVCKTNTNKLSKTLCYICYSKKILSTIHDDWECKECKTNTNKASKTMCVACYSKEYIRKNATYKTYYNKLNKYHETRKNGKYIEVRCTHNKCKKWFIPTIGQVRIRLGAIYGRYGFNENNFYCSEECKHNCSVFNSRINSVMIRDALTGNEWENLEALRDSIEYKEFILLTLKKANYICEKCGSKHSVKVHHEKPVKTHPHLALDTENAFVLCDSCHKEIHSRNGCTYNDLGKKICRIKINKEKGVDYGD